MITQNRHAIARDSVLDSINSESIFLRELVMLWYSRNSRSKKHSTWVRKWFKKIWWLTVNKLVQNRRRKYIWHGVLRLSIFIFIKILIYARKPIFLFWFIWFFQSIVPWLWQRLFLVGRRIHPSNISTNSNILKVLFWQNRCHFFHNQHPFLELWEIMWQNCWKRGNMRINQFSEIHSNA